MTRGDTETLIRKLIRGDPTEAAQTLEQAADLADTTRERQLVAIAAAHLAGETDRADFLAREHLIDYPDSAFAAWIAAVPDRTTAPSIHQPERN
jgi:hypothetical protein